MRAEFWLERWRTGATGWHQAAVNPLLIKHWPALNLSSRCSVFVPLCGKSLDMRWLREAGHSLFGVELAEAAVRAFFEEASIPFERVENPGELPRFSGGGYHIYCGDYLEISAPQLHVAKGTYDRGALIALPPKQRMIYADHVQRVIPRGGRILLLTLEYDQAKADGPPFSVEAGEVQALYGARCRVEPLERLQTDDLPPHFKEAGMATLTERVYRIVKER